MNIKPILFTLIALTTLTFTACKDDGSDSGPNNSTGILSDATKKKLYDKTWYTGMGINFMFFTDGTFRLNKSLDGTWEWLNQGDTMLVTNYDNRKYLNLFSTIGDHQAKYTSSQGSDNFKTVVTLSDTE
jgi:hypothetical protein